MKNEIKFKENNFINERTTKLIAIAQECPALSLLEIFSEYPILDASFFSIFELIYIESELEHTKHLIEIWAIISANLYDLAITDFGKAEQILSLFTGRHEVEFHIYLSAFLHSAKNRKANND